MAGEQPAGAGTIGLPARQPVLPAVVLRGAVGVGGVAAMDQVGLTVGVVVDGDCLGETDHHAPVTAAAGG